MFTTKNSCCYNSLKLFCSHACSNWLKHIFRVLKGEIMIWTHIFSTQNWKQTWACLRSCSFQSIPKQHLLFDMSYPRILFTFVLKVTVLNYTQETCLKPVLVSNQKCKTTAEKCAKIIRVFSKYKKKLNFVLAKLI